MTKRNHVQKQYMSAYDHRAPFALLTPNYTAIRDLPECMYDKDISIGEIDSCLLYTSPSPRDS